MEFSQLIPELILSSIDKSLDFYLNVVGFTACYERPEEKFAFIEFEGSQMMLLEDNENMHSRTGELNYPRGQGVNFSIATQDLGPIVQKLTAIGHPLRIPMRERWHRKEDVLLGQKQLWVMDPDGYLLRFVQSIGHKPV
jgi:lactoylglutathione lyase